MLLGTASIGVSAVRRAERREVEAAVERAEWEAMQQESPLEEPSEHPPAENPEPVVERTETVGGLTVRVLSNRRVVVFTRAGEHALDLDGFVEVREVPGAEVLGGPLVRLIGKTCDDPCNPTVVLLGVRDGDPVELLRAGGVANLEDLDGDGAPEVLLDHLVEGSHEVVTLPLKLDPNRRRYRAAYEQHPEGVDRQIEQLTAAAERICTPGVEQDCRDTLEGLLALSFFGPGKDTNPVDRMRLEPRAKAYARRPDVVIRLEAQMQLLAP